MNYLTAWRDVRSIEDAIKDHNKAQLAVAISMAVSFVALCLKGTKYAQYAAFLDPDMVTGIGLLAAGGFAGVGHWSTKGALVAAAVAGPAGDAPASGQGSLGASVGGQPADASKPATVWRGDPAQNPSNSYGPG